MRHLPCVLRRLVFTSTFSSVLALCVGMASHEGRCAFTEASAEIEQQDVTATRNQAMMSVELQEVLDLYEQGKILLKQLRGYNLKELGDLREVIALDTRLAWILLAEGTIDNCPDVVEHLLEKANARSGKDACAQTILGRMFEKGWGVAVNTGEAYKFYLQAAKAGNLYAQTRLGSFYIKGRHIIKHTANGLKWLRQASDKDFPPAQTKLAKILSAGIETEKDEAEAMELYSLAAIENYPKAQYYLGTIYANAPEPQQDMQKAAHYYKLAAEQGY